MLFRSDTSSETAWEPSHCVINSRTDYVLTLSKTTLFSTLTAVAISILSIHSASADSIVRAEKLSSSANRSYKVAGKRYTPMTKVSNFSQTGNASWYGSQFHGRKTSSGERYNMNALTAAHKTLPIPSYARVTNTKNGKSVIYPEIGRASCRERV